MAMNKKEQKLLEDMKVRAALRWTFDYDAPLLEDVPKPDPGSDVRYVEGWSVHSYLGHPGVSPSWSRWGAHGRDHEGDQVRYGGSQGGIDQFSSKLLALRALRQRLELKVAEMLHAVDVQIEEETRS